MAWDKHEKAVAAEERRIERSTIGKVASRARVQLLLAVALERAGRRAEAEALHARSGAARGEGGRVSSLHHGDTRNHLRETRRPLRALQVAAHEFGLVRDA